ncbi:MAG TPA: (2Fe-2S)-binding protein [Angustibacter sp.]|nr:(2Fe-2S)-binding protein [Angustibacter sp.]
MTTAGSDGPVRFTVNGEDVEVLADDGAPLLHVLREQLGLKGARFGCGLGMCGACFVQVDDAVVSSCDTPVSAVAGRRVRTVEGLARDGVPHPVQRAVLDEQAAQCGYCTSGLLVSAAALLDRDPEPDEAAVVEALDRHLCRCGVQRRMVRAVVAAGRSRPPERRS